MLQLIEHSSQSGCRARVTPENQQILGLLDAPAELTQHASTGAAGVDLLLHDRTANVPYPAGTVPALLQPQLGKVTTDRGLSSLAPLCCKRCHHLLLTIKRGIPEDPLDQLLPLPLVHYLAPPTR